MFFNKKYIATRRLYVTTIIYSVFPILGAVVQYMFYDGLNVELPFLVGSLVVACVVGYIHIIGDQVQLDYLTGTYTRYPFYKRLETKIKQHHGNLFVVMIDLNDFKAINDTYGHNDGDEALVVFSKALKTVGDRYQAFTARYGGDEFSVILELENKDDINNYCQEITEEIENLDWNKTKKQKISASIGYAHLNSNEDTLLEIIKRADMQMYGEKIQYHSKASIKNHA